jgi:hypothetical protein
MHSLSSSQVPAFARAQIVADDASLAILHARQAVRSNYTILELVTKTTNAFAQTTSKEKDQCGPMRTSMRRTSMRMRMNENIDGY